MDEVEAYPAAAWNSPGEFEEPAAAQQLAPLACAWEADVAQGARADALMLLETAVALLSDEYDEVAAAAHAAVLRLAPLLAPAKVIPALLQPLDALLASPDADPEGRAALAGLLCALGPALGCGEAERELLPRAVALAANPAFPVRKAVAMGLPRLGAALPPSEARTAALLRACAALTTDSVWSVRAAAAASLPALAPLLPLRERRCALAAAARRLAGDASRWVVTAAAAALGPLLAELAPADVGDDLLEFLAAAPSCRENDSAAALATAAALPALAHLLGAARWEALRPALHAVADADAPAAASALAGGLAAIAGALGPEAAERELMPLLDRLLEIGGDEAAGSLAPNLAPLLAALPPRARVGSLQRLAELLAADGGGWRVRAALAGQLGMVASCLDTEGMLCALLPLALRLCRDRIAAVRTAAAAQGRWAGFDAAGHWVDRLGELAGERCHRLRLAFLGACASALLESSPSADTQCGRLLGRALVLAADPVPNVSGEAEQQGAC
ncbi:hypothetical protein WJX81_005665 [Elliptochloris bilobata]|uniref:Uncharacterized protein n=1 Tax=Elliptochloris bilobata TaxID=381761 RepID=A0AAW1SIU7_9CHLO